MATLALQSDKKGAEPFDAQSFMFQSSPLNYFLPFQNKIPVLSLNDTGKFDRAPRPGHLIRDIEVILVVLRHVDDALRVGVLVPAVVGAHNLVAHDVRDLAVVTARRDRVGGRGLERRGERVLRAWHRGSGGKGGAWSTGVSQDCFVLQGRIQVELPGETGL